MVLYIGYIEVKSNISLFHFHWGSVSFIVPATYTKEVF